VLNVSKIQCSNTFDTTGLIATPLKSSQITDLVRQSFNFGTGTIYNYIENQRVHVD